MDGDDEIITPVSVYTRFYNDGGVEIASIVDANGMWICDCWFTHSDEIVARINGKK